MDRVQFEISNACHFKGTDGVTFVGRECPYYWENTKAPVVRYNWPQPTCAYDDHSADTKSQLFKDCPCRAKAKAITSFKIGDKVRVTEGIHAGCEGTVTREHLYFEEQFCWVSEKPNECMILHARKLELIKEG